MDRILTYNEKMIKRPSRAVAGFPNLTTIVADSLELVALALGVNRTAIV